jgi:hypothetical protein
MKARFRIAGLAGLMALGVGPVGVSAQGVPPAMNVLLGIDAASGRFQPNRRVVQGQLVTRGLFPERYRIRHTGIPSGYRVKSVTLAGRDVTEEGFDLSAGPIDDMVIALTKRITAVTGVVRDAQNLPDGEASVLAFPTNPRLWTGTGQAPSFIDVVPVSQKGNYALNGLPPGEYFVIATASSGLPVSRSMYDADTLGRLAAAAARIRLTEGQAVTLDLRTN